MFLPYRIETLFKHWPVANIAIMVITVVFYFATDFLSEDAIRSMVLGGTSPVGLVGHVLLHGSIIHLAGNMIFLWVFGNAVCGMTSNLVYPLLYLGFGVLAAAAHVAFSDAPAIGASGAVNGIVGMAFAMYPRNAVSVFYFVVFRAGTFELPLWVLALFWFAYDTYGALSGAGGIAYWAHLGGFLGGVSVGMVALKFRWITLTEYDNPTLADLFKSKPKPKRAGGKWTWEDPMTLKD